MHPDPILISDVDADGALREQAETVRGTHTRAGLLARGALAAGGALVGGGLLTGHASAQSGGDVHILNFALLLEYLEGTFYADVRARGILTTDAAKRFAAVAGDHEAQHVRFLQGALGSKAIAKPTFDFSKVADEASFLVTAIQLEDTGVSAYKGQAPLIADAGILASALKVHSVEARHAAWVRFIAEGSGSDLQPVGPGLDQPQTEQQVTGIVKATGFVTSPLPTF